MSRLAEFYATTDPLARNGLLFGWLSDDAERSQFYHELREKAFPVLRFKSLRRQRSADGWSMEDVYLVTRRSAVEAALKHYSVKPYSDLGSGGRFMLGLDDPEAHKKQRGAAASAMRFSSDELAACATAAVHRSAIRPLKSHQFDLSDLAEQAALNYAKLLFGLRDEAHVALQILMAGAYRGLVYQIVGRHFVPQADAGLPSPGSPRARELQKDLDAEIGKATEATGKEPFREGAPADPVIKRLFRNPGGLDVQMLKVIVIGLIAGMIGNVRAAVPIALYHFFTRRDGSGRPLIDEARSVAGDTGTRLGQLITEALLANPPAPFLARTSRPAPTGAAVPTYTDDTGSPQPIPDGAHVLLAIGAEPNPSSLFGGTFPEFMHQCIGEHLAWPLIHEVVRQILLLPGLTQVIDAGTGKATVLKKRWGAISEPYPLQYQRDRRLNQQPLYVVLPIKEPVKQNAEKLKALTKAGGHIVEQSLSDSGIVHFAWFMLVENETCLALSTVYDGDFDAYVEHFASKVPLFDKQFEYLADAPPTPIAKHPKEFVEIIRKYNRAPLADYFFSAYPTVSVAQVKNMRKAAP
jgi:cytochrome P450